MMLGFIGTNRHHHRIWEIHIKMSCSARELATNAIELYVTTRTPLSTFVLRLEGALDQVEPGTKQLQDLRDLWFELELRNATSD